MKVDHARLKAGPRLAAANTTRGPGRGQPLVAGRPGGPGSGAASPPPWQVPQPSGYPGCPPFQHDGYPAANVDGVDHPGESGCVDFDTNTVLNGDADGLRQIVEGDLFRANVTVSGEISYKTQIGGKDHGPKRDCR